MSNMSTDCWVIILCFQVYLASWRNIYICSEMSTEVLCALLVCMGEVKGLNIGSTNFRSNAVVLLEYFLMCLGHFRCMFHHAAGWIDLLQKIFTWDFLHLPIHVFRYVPLIVLVVTFTPALLWALGRNYSSSVLCIAMPSVIFHAQTERKPKMFKQES